MDEEDYLKFHAAGKAAHPKDGTGPTVLAILRAYLSLPVKEPENEAARVQCLEMLRRHEAKSGANVIDWDLPGICLVVGLIKTNLEFLSEAGMMLSIAGLLKR